MASTNGSGESSKNDVTSLENTVALVERVQTATTRLRATSLAHAETSEQTRA